MILRNLPGARYVEPIAPLAMAAEELLDLAPGHVGMVELRPDSSPPAGEEARALVRLLCRAQDEVDRRYAAQRPAWNALADAGGERRYQEQLHQCLVPVVYALDFATALTIREVQQLGQAGATYVESAEEWAEILGELDRLHAEEQAAAQPALAYAD